MKNNDEATDRNRIISNNKKYMRQPALTLQKSFNLYHNMSAEGQGPRIV